MWKTLILLVACVTAVAAPAAFPQGCRSGTQEYAREQIAPNRVRVYCVCNSDVTAIAQTDEAIAALSGKLESNRAAIRRWNAELPDFMRSLDEWVAMDSQARAQTRAAAWDVAITGFMGLMQIIANRNVEVRRAEMHMLWTQFNSGALGSARFQQMLRQQRAGAAAMRKWESYGDALQAVETARGAINGLNDAQREEYARALMQFMALAIQDPRASILVSELDFTAAALYGNLTAWEARARVNQLLRLGDEKLRGMGSLAKIHRENVDAMNLQKRKRDEIIERATRPGGSCPQSVS